MILCLAATLVFGQSNAVAFQPSTQETSDFWIDPANGSFENQAFDAPLAQDTLPIRRIDDPQELARIKEMYRDDKLAPKLEDLWRSGPLLTGLIQAGLQSSDANDLVKTLDKIIQMGEYSFDFKSNPEIDSLLVRLSQTTGGFKQKAILALASCSPVHCTARIMAFITQEDDDPSVRQKVFRALSHASQTPSIIDFIGDFLGDKDPGTALAAFNALCELHYADGCTLRSQINALLIPFLASANLQDQNLGLGIHQLTMHASRDLLPTYEKLYELKGQNQYALGAIAELDGAKAIPRVEALIADKDRSYQAIPMISFAWKNDPQGALKAILELERLQKGSYQQELLEIAFNMGGQPMAERYLSGMSPSSGMDEYAPFYFQEITAKHPLRSKATALYNAGLIDQPISDAQLLDLKNTALFGHFPDYGEILLHFLPGFFELEIDADFYYAYCNGLLSIAGSQFQTAEFYLHNNSPGMMDPPSEMFLLYKDVGFAIGPCAPGSGIGEQDILRMVNQLLASQGIEKRISRVPADYNYYMLEAPSKLAQIYEVLELVAWE